MEQFLRESGRGGRPALGFWNSFADPLLVEMVASLQPDYVCIDMQHGETSEADLVGLLQAVTAGGSVPVVRVAENNGALIMMALDSGASGVIVPLVESGEEAARAVAACRYPPLGRRSYGPLRAAIHAGTTDPRELEKVACVVMIETRAGIDSLEEIVATEGLTGVYVGPSDLSLALGLPPASLDAPQFVSVLEEIRAACVRHGVVPGIHCPDGQTAARYLQQGFGMVTVAVDLSVLRAGMARELAIGRAETPQG